MEKVFYRLRNRWLSPDRAIKNCERRFYRQTLAAYARGSLLKARGLVLYEGDRRPLIVGSHLDVLALDGAVIVMTGSGKNQPGTFPRNVTFPSATAIGFIPTWKHLNPPIHEVTRLRLQSNSRLVTGPNTLICKGTYISIWPDQALELEGDNYIGHGSYINTRMGLKIGRGTTMSHRVTIMDYDGHPIFFDGQSENSASYGGKSEKIEIGRNVWVGFGVSILKGVRIGDGPVIAANSCVVTDVPSNTIVAGNPARVVKERVSWRQF